MFLFPLAIVLLGTIFSIENMSIEEKVGQTLMVHFQGEEVNRDAEVLVQELAVGGIIYYNWANGLHSPQQVQTLSNGLQKLVQCNNRPIPLLIAVDQEGGVVNRLTMGFTKFPGNRVLGLKNDEALAEAVGEAIGQELRAVGVNMNLAPVIDIASHPDSAMSKRSFGSSPEQVARLSSRQLQGYHRAKIAVVCKHFPGLGAVSVDSHNDLPILHKSLEELQSCEFIPYQRLAIKADAIMTAHVLVPSLDSKNCATLSATILQEILQKKIGYNGIVISDSLIMEGLLKNSISIQDAAIQAFNAGCDIILLGGRQLVGTRKNFELTIANIQQIRDVMVEAVKNGQISEERLNRSVSKILKLKTIYELSTTKFPDATDIQCFVNTEEHKKLASFLEEVAK